MKGGKQFIRVDEGMANINFICGIIRAKEESKGYIISYKHKELGYRHIYSTKKFLEKDDLIKTIKNYGIDIKENDIKYKDWRIYMRKELFNNLPKTMSEALAITQHYIYDKDEIKLILDVKKKEGKLYLGNNDYLDISFKKDPKGIFIAFDDRYIWDEHEVLTATLTRRWFKTHLEKILDAEYDAFMRGIEIIIGNFKDDYGNRFKAKVLIDKTYFGSWWGSRFLTEPEIIRD